MTGCLEQRLIKINLFKATGKDDELIHRMQVESFYELYLKYSDIETSPVNKSVEKIVRKLIGWKYHDHK